jgi:uncharacterized protein
MTATGPQPRVLVVSGHMVDDPDRPRPRFPPDQVARVAAEVAVALDRWGIDAGTTVICGGARGADIIAAEQAQGRGAKVVLCLALPPAEFAARSVDLPDSDWADRFEALLATCEVRLLEHELGHRPPPEKVFSRTNQWMVELARSLCGGTPHALVVWDGGAGDGPGGTRDLVKRLGHTGPSATVAVIDPTRRSYQRKERAEGHKRLLALDGGGIRGVLSLRILRELEAQLRQRQGNDAFVLSDYFDYIGGTSTGAIIATGLALGMPVAELEAHYRQLAGEVFTKRFLPLRLRSRYRDGPLSEQLDRIIGRDRTLGDPELRSLLLLVLHNTVTDSVWPLSNSTRARYNRADRALIEPSDRNLDIPLTTLVRGSTAAPVYFPPQEIEVGAHRFLFQDGGITPFNNPAMLLYLMATLPEYGLSWPVGAEQLLLISVGTGSSAAVHPGLRSRSVNVLFNAKNLPSVFMNGAAVGQDMLCRSFGRTRVGLPLDREFGDRLDAEIGSAGEPLFTYLRFDADLSDAALIAAGVGPRRRRSRIRALDAVSAMDDLEALGAGVAATVDVERQLAGFL